MARYYYFLTASCVLIGCNLLVAHGGDVPAGHMRPFGAHMPPEPVEELTDKTMPSPETFWRDYVSIRKPVVFRGAAHYSPALTKWTDEYLKRKYGKLEVRIEAKKEKQGYIPVGDLGVGRDTIQNFIDTYHERNKYIVSELPRQMHEEVMVIPGMACGSMSRRIVEVDWWMNGGNASSIIHKDAFNQINCLMNGTKEWKLIEQKHEKNIYKAWEPEREIGGYSRINPNRVDLIKYPKVSTVPWKFTVLNGGDCLYLPGSMYHQVTPYGTNNFAVSLLFSRFDNEKNLDFSDCSNSSKYEKLSNFDVDWQYPGTGTMTMGAPDLENIRNELLGFISSNGRLSLKLLYMMLREVFPERNREKVKKQATENYNRIFEATGGKLTTKDIKNLPKKVLRILALTLQPVDASNTYDHEYTYIRPEDIERLIFNLLKGKRITRSSFVAKYEAELYGTKKFANKIFDVLAGESVEAATADQIQSKMSKALEKFYKLQRDQPEPPQGETSTGDAYDGTNADTEMYETGMPDMSEEDADETQDRVMSGTSEDNEKDGSDSFAEIKERTNKKVEL